MRAMLLAALFCPLLLAAGGETILLRDGTVHPVSGEEISVGSVLVRDGRIAAVGRTVSAPRGSRVINLKGLHVYPGMIDSGTQVGLTEIRAVRETSDVQEIGDFHPQLRTLIAINPSSEHILVARANGITAAIALPDGGIVSGQAALVHLDGWTWEEMRIQESTAIHLQFPTIDFGRRGLGRDASRPETYKEAEKQYQGTLRKLREFFEESRRYQKARSGTGTGFEVDVKYEAMLPVLDRRLPVLVTAVRRRAIRAALDFAEQQEIRIILSQPRQVEEFAAELKEKNIPVILGPTLELPVEEDDSYDSSYALPAHLHAAGVRFAFASFDSSRSRNLPYQAAMSVAFGLPVNAALRALTLGAAEIWGVAKELGSIEEGKIADLIVTDGDPLETRTQIKYLIVNGRQVDPTANKQYRLYEKYRGRR